MSFIYLSSSITDLVNRNHRFTVPLSMVTQVDLWRVLQENDVLFTFWDASYIDDNKKNTIFLNALYESFWRWFSPFQSFSVFFSPFQSFSVLFSPFQFFSVVRNFAHIMLIRGPHRYYYRYLSFRNARVLSSWNRTYFSIIHWKTSSQVLYGRFVLPPRECKYIGQHHSLIQR